MKYKDRADKLHKNSIIIDGLNVSKWGDEEVFRHIHQGGFTAINATMNIWELAEETLQNITRFDKYFDEFSDLIRPVLKVSDIHAAKNENRVGIIFGLQNACAVEDDPGLAEVLYKAGVRVIQLTFNYQNNVGCGCYELKDSGLTEFGRDLIGEMDRLGIVIDLSHVGRQTTMDAIEASVNPVWFSHANPMTLKEHRRNKTDEQIKALVDKGGVIGANIFPPFLKRGYESTSDDFVDVIDYLVETAGIDHVAIGLDYTEKQSPEWFDWLTKVKKGQPALHLELPFRLPQGLERADRLVNLTRGLMERGYSEEHINKILGLNNLTLFNRVWAQ